MGLKDCHYSTNELLEAVTIPDHLYEKTIGIALRRMIDLSDIGPQFYGNCNGLDALAYHLDVNTIDKAINTLERVKEYITNNL
jgi:hypothetical protein